MTTNVTTSAVDAKDGVIDTQGAGTLGAVPPYRK